MRVLYLNYEWDPRESPGALTHIRELSRGLTAMGHTVIVENRRRAGHVVPGGPEAREPRAVPTTVRIRQRLAPYLHEAAAFCRALRGIRAEVGLIRAHRPDVVLTRHSLHQFSSLAAARRCGVPIVFEVNAPAAYEYRHYRDHYHLLPGFAEWLELRMLARADGIFVVSELLKRHFVDRGMPEGKVRVVPNGVDTARFRPGTEDPLVRKLFGEKSVVLGFVGSFARFHGIDQLRDAIDFLAPLRPESCFLMVGKGELSGDLQEHCRRQGLSQRVHFTGHVPPDDVPGLMAAADILLAPYEAQEFFYLSPIKIFEYMAVGRAVVAAGVGQLREVIQDGENGVLYEPASRGALGAQLLRLVDSVDLRKRLGEAARRTVEQRHTWRANAENVSALLEQVRIGHRAEVR